jgi:hypothetical protein
MSGWISYILIRLLADSVKLRLYIDFKDWKVKVGRTSQLPSASVLGRVSKALSRQKEAPNSHIHHFIFGMALMPVTFIALYWRFWYGPVLVGIVMALIFSEIKELVLMSWGQ